MQHQARRPLDAEVIRRQRVRHLKNRRDSLVIGILQAERSGDLERVAVIRDEANKVNRMLKELQ